MDQSLMGKAVHPMDEGYISFRDFQKYMKSATPSSYQSTFSFSKLIRELKVKREALQDDILSPTIDRLEVIETQLQQDTSSWEVLHRQGDFRVLLLQIFPSFFFKDQMGFIKGPFENDSFRYVTNAFQELLNNEEWEIKLNAQKFMRPDAQNILMAGTLVLNTFYGQNVDIYIGGMTLRDRNTKMERHYKFNVQLDYLEAKPIQPLKELSQQQIHELLNNLEDEQLWFEHIPPQNFVFEGFVIIYLSDVTKPEILSTLKELAVDEGGKIDHEDDLRYLEILARSYLEMPDLHLGALQTVYSPWEGNLTWCLLRHYNIPMMRACLENPDSIYGNLLRQRQPVIIEDLEKQPSLTSLETALLEKGFRSLLLAPLTDDTGRIISIFELGSPNPYRFSRLTLLQMEEFITLFELGTNKFIQEMDRSIRLTIQQEFTSIHPSVEWKFRQVANKFFWERLANPTQSSPDPIVFKQVYPLYGQADIVGSSNQRNHSIQTDLTDNLERLHQLLIACRNAVSFHLLDVYVGKVQAYLERLQKNAYISSDESVIVELLTEQIHPLLRQLRLRFPQLPKDMLDAYFGYLDPELGIVYRLRKAYEESVGLINQTISNYLQQEEEKMQQILPHFFEKFQTDGVEYNIYLGQSLLEEGEFHPFYLHDFRLWQLIAMCEITRLVERKSNEFPIALKTAQLIFVYNNSLSISFQMDSKQFDVDGAYNVRYEILKKRIDKAYIKGTDQRLTQAGKIAIVWLQEKDRQEYQEYLDHLVHQGYIHPEIEDLELEKMQGVEGLKAIRVRVVVD